MKKRTKEDLPSHIVGIGASAGGLEALQTLFEYMPNDLGVAYVVVQHLSPDFKSMMGELLSKVTSMPATQAQEGEELKANRVYLIPAGKLMRVAEGKFYLSELPPDNRINLPINEFFRTLADDAQNRAVGIVLSGTGSDGSRGIQSLKEMGGLVIAQDPDEAKFDGMPTSAINTRSVDFTLKMEDIPKRIQQFISHPLTQKNRTDFREHLTENIDIIDRILNLIQSKTELDFKAYKESTVSRRIGHRMSINSLHNLGEYWEFLIKNPEEVEQVKQDLLIGVTQFCRDPHVWERAYDDVIKPLLVDSSPLDPIRIWVAGCSTGEEAYTIGMLFSEALLELEITRNITIFASDIDQSAINVGATGIYPPSISSEVPTTLLHRYFNVLQDGSFQVVKELRAMVVFAAHNLIQDPPFSNMDLVSCRNTLIYLQNPAQHKVLAFFHFAVKLGGCLVLGTAESPGSFSNHFDTIDSKAKIYRKSRDSKISPSPISPTPRMPTRHYHPRTLPQFISMANDRINKTKKTTAIGRDVLVDHYVPPTLIVNSKLQVVFSYGDTSAFTAKIKPGHISNDLADILQTRFSGQALSAAHQVLRERQSVLMKGITDESGKAWSLKCFDFMDGNELEPFVVLSFVPNVESGQILADVEYDIDEQTQKRIEELDHALIDCQKLYRESLEELDTTREELQSSNEELMAANEELQSTNEELQSVNEELYTVNSEHQQKIFELTEINNDLENLMIATNLAVLFLDNELRIRRFTDALKNFVNIIEFDLNRDFRDLSFKEPLQHLDKMVLAVNSGSESQIIKIFKSDKQSVEVNVLPYKIGDSQRGVIISMHEINTKLS
ncbi:chemotaxis protein CheR [Vibrio sp. 10N.286.49.B3]|uniref:chemotaxis protein CheB n=1 Tax=Vibrio sp. 10N.286.49.B3 TaxID=1880855 RepID=UPI000C829FA5|nr:chemotaxis protein CheB [Vibrio sp. 10N.286.49.B3]PMH46134.1 chemotaxis protein CheR [Vibrio sp. 10N.286.49.B3]